MRETGLCCICPAEKESRPGERRPFRCAGRKRDAARLKHLPYFRCGALVLLPVLFEAVAIVVVAVPAEEADIDEACPDGYPGRTEVNDTEFVKHVPPVLIGMRGAAWAVSNKMHSPALLFAWFTLHKHKYAACYALTKKRMKRRMNTSALW